MTSNPHQLLFDLIGELARRRYREAERAFAPLGLNHTAARLMTLLGQADGLATQEQLSARIGVDRSNVGRALKQLEDEGLIRRQQDTHDKRSNQVQITLAGTEIVERISAIRAEMAQTFFGDLTAADAKTVLALLDRNSGGNDHE